MRWGSGTKRALSVVGAVALVSLGAGCSDDGPADPVSAAEYQEAVDELCEQHGDAFAEASENFEDNARSDSERIAYFRTDFIPRVRTIINALDERGLPEGRVDEYRAIFGSVLEVVQRFEEQTPQFIDDYRAGRLDEADNFPQLIREGLAEADVHCLG